MSTAIQERRKIWLESDSKEKGLLEPNCMNELTPERYKPMSFEAPQFGVERRAVGERLKWGLYVNLLFTCDGNSESADILKASLSPEQKSLRIDVQNLKDINDQVIAVINDPELAVYRSNNREYGLDLIQRLVVLTSLLQARSM